MTDKVSFSEYHIEKTERWWEKEIDPTVSFIFLVGAMVSVFGMGVIFMREYTGIWTEISQRESQFYSIEQVRSLEQPDSDIQFKDIVTP